MENEDLVSIYTVKSAAEAEIVCNALKSFGIAAAVGGEGQAGLAGVLEIDILTHVSDADRARKHLRQLRKEKKLRRQRHAEAKRAREAGAELSSEPSSEAIQELPRPGIAKKEPEEPDEETDSR